MPNNIYPQGTIKALLASDEVNAQTKKVLNERLQGKERIKPAFFDDKTFTVLEAVCDILFPQISEEQKIPLAILYEESLATGKGKGWRYSQMPPLKAAITQGLKGVDEEALQVHQSSFAQLLPATKEILLTNIQQGKAIAEIWKGLRSDLFFEELLASLTELYYSHPMAKDVIGDVSFSDAKGWMYLGLNNLEDREPRPLKSVTDAAV